MAQALKLVRLNEFGADVDSLDLLAFAAGISVKREGYIPNFDGGSEVITLTVKGASRDALATALQSLETKFEQIRYFIQSSVEPYCVVLREQAPNETNPRQSLVTGYSVKLGSSLHQANLFVQDYRLAIDRVARWEATVSAEVELLAQFDEGQAVAVELYQDVVRAMPGDGSDLTYTLAFTPQVGTLVALSYVWGSVVKAATCTYAPGANNLVDTEETPNTIAVLTGTTMVIEGDLTDPGSNVDVQYFVAGSTAEGRVGRMTLKGVSGKGTITELWAGFRTGRFGTLADFVSLWEAETGTVGTDASATTDATATPGGGGNTKIAVTFATATMQKRLTLTAYQIDNTHYADLRGTFDIVARLKVGSGTTVDVRLDVGMLNGSTFTASQIGDQVTVSSTTWKYYNLGRVTLPPVARVTSNLDAMKTACLALYAERTAGSNALDIDHFVPIPVDEGMLHLSGLNVAYASNATNQRAEVYCDALGNLAGVQYASGAVVNQVTVNGTLADWFMPKGSAILVCAMQTSSPALTDEITLVFDVFKRYPTLRGAA